MAFSTINLNSSSSIHVWFFNLTVSYGNSHLNFHRLTAPHSMNMNIFQHILHCLNIPYTTAYSSRVYEEHPYKDSLYGVFRLLALYGGKARG